MDLFASAEKSFFDVYKRFPIAVEKGRGAYIYDKNGNAYLDFLAGIAVNALGYGHPAVNEAITKQLDRNLHLSNYFIQDIQVDLAEAVLQHTPFRKIFLTNSGTEAIEGLLKAVKKWANQNFKSEIIAFTGSFHGRSLGALSLTMQAKYQDSFKPLLPNTKALPFNDVQAFQAAVGPQTAAVFYEGVTGEGGIHPVSDAMFAAMEEARRRFDILLITDEIQTGVGRTGSFYYYQQTPVVPDGLASAKGLGGGLPLGAFLVGERLQNIFGRGEHGTTYGGNPLACAAGYAAVKTIGSPDFLNTVKDNGAYLRSGLNKLQNKYPRLITDVRGKGLMCGAEVSGYAPQLMDAGCSNGLLFNIAGGNTLRFVPPLIIGKNHIDEALVKLEKTINQVLA